MTCPFMRYPDRLTSLLRDFDIYGMPGHALMKHQYNIMLDEVRSTSIEGIRYLHGIPVCPEGSSAEMMINGCFPKYSDNRFGDEVTVACEVHPPYLDTDSKVLLWNVADGMDVLRQDKADWVFHQDSVYIPFAQEQNHRLHCLETFSGGFGGWQYALSFISEKYGIPCQTVSIESDLQAAQTYCMNHDAVLIDAMREKTMIDLRTIDKNIVLYADVRSENWWHIVSRWSVDLMTISSPCQPWTVASTGPGLNCDLGCLLPFSTMMGRIFRPKAILYEQVPGFTTHEHKQIVLATMKGAGYRLKWAKILDSG